MTPAQARAARAALKWSLKDLGRHASIHRNTAWAFEHGETIAEDSITAIRGALEDGGVTFTKRGELVGIRFPTAL